MRTVARAATSSLIMLGAALALVVVAVAATGIAGTDPPAEHADIARFGRQWAAVRALLSPADLPAAPTPAANGQAGSAQADTGQAGSARAGSALTAAYTPVSAHLGQLFQRELGDARTDHARADAGAVLVIGLIAGAAALGLALGAVFLARGIRRIRGSLEPSQDQAEFADTLQIAGDEDGGRAALLSCPVCAPVAGTSCCVPLTVGGEVIGSVLLSRPEPYSEAEEQRIRESVGQAAPVLANLRNLAVAEIRAATDGLTGLPNVSVTASIGVAVFPDHASTPDRLERLADAALYLAKRQGRNRVELADPSPAPTPVPPAANGAAPLTEAAPR